SIIYSVRLVSDGSGLPGWARPILDGLLALNIDLAMDAVAIRLGMWDWGMGLERQYFGVPWANFWAWFWVVSSFSAGLRLADRWRHPAAPWLAPGAAVVIGLVGVLATNALIVFVVPRALYETTVALTLAAALGLVAWQRPRFDRAPAEPPAVWVPLVSHLYFLAAGLLAGVFQAAPVLLAVSALMFAAALGLHPSLWRPALTRLAGPPKPGSGGSSS
ncbi:MAG: carotenoid biosynthesis protein, partial [Anaerolineales bacterium]|nr:carotenoid biosynthesis protein [Anaerolineales bacterium]